MKSVLKFNNNEPREIVLAFAQGKITPSNFGADQVMYTLADPPDHITFLDLQAAQKVNQLRAAQGERIVICKRKDGGAVRWDVSLAQSAELARAAAEAGVPLKENGRPAWGGKPAAADPDSELERGLRASVAEIERKKAEAAARTAAAAPAATREPNGAALAPRACTKLEDALKTAVAAAFAATEYAKSIGYASMPLFTSEDLRTMANTLIIDANRGRG